MAMAIGGDVIVKAGVGYSNTQSAMGTGFINNTWQEIKVNVVTPDDSLATDDVS
jgi:hypothetical protein